jgi:hypothetical protein
MSVIKVRTSNDGQSVMMGNSNARFGYQYDVLLNAVKRHVGGNGTVIISEKKRLGYRKVTLKIDTYGERFTVTQGIGRGSQFCYSGLAKKLGHSLKGQDRIKLYVKTVKA